MLPALSTAPCFNNAAPYSYCPVWMDKQKLCVTPIMPAVACKQTVGVGELVPLAKPCLLFICIEREDAAVSVEVQAFVVVVMWPNCGGIEWFE